MAPAIRVKAVALGRLQAISAFIATKFLSFGNLTCTLWNRALFL